MFPMLQAEDLLECLHYALERNAKGEVIDVAKASDKDQSK